jgi:TetR/AcrR family transcriptional regulator, transcriptional repressor for nem operon
MEKFLMRYPAEETAERHRLILEVASVLFRERGFDGVSVGQVMKASGMTQGAFYHHFESKEALIEECLRDASAKSLEKMAGFAERPELMAAHIQEYISEWHRDALGTGCMIAALGSDAAHEPFVQPVFTEHVEGVLNGLMMPGVSSEPKGSRRDAIQTLSGMVGALILSRAVDDPELSNEILRESRSGFEK